ncbi:hypothetical protein [Corynebacterium propinquum]|uniref:hypothetical protein n=1 Tax=Corynebacterium propinquum TaxID=43769 RepID=UPI0012DEF696|nr:hypothetical protein [Corynebacterium propinquum]QQU86946.1 hypothetical protein I6I70_04750 [Corynebacterium propinquum]QQU90936.1 hypothetical protein I6I69_01290 [Corynebacterium propinquum]WKS45281.1 hypothetical protein NLL36_01685 [Corynebacterium propinquum]
MSKPKPAIGSVKRRGLAIATAVVVVGSGIATANYVSAQEEDRDPTYEELKAEFGETQADAIAKESARKAYEALIKGNVDDVDQIFQDALNKAAKTDDAGFSDADVQAIDQEELKYQIDGLVADEKDAAKLAHEINAAIQQGKSKEEINSIVKSGLEGAGYNPAEITDENNSQIAAIVSGAKQRVEEQKSDREPTQEELIAEFGGLDSELSKQAEAAAKKAADALAAGKSADEVNKIFADAVKEAAKNDDSGFDEDDIERLGQDELNQQIVELLKEEQAAADLAHKVAQAVQAGQNQEAVKGIIKEGLKDAGFSEADVESVNDSEIVEVYSAAERRADAKKAEPNASEFGAESDKIANEAAKQAADAMKNGAPVDEIKKIFEDAVKNAAKAGDAGFGEKDIDDTELNAQISEVLKEEQAAEALANQIASALKSGTSDDEIKAMLKEGLKQAGFSDEEVAGVADEQVAAIVDEAKQKANSQDVEPESDVEQEPEFGEKADAIAKAAAAKAAEALKAGASVAEAEKIFADAVKEAAKARDAGFTEADVDESLLQAEIADVLKDERAAEELAPKVADAAKAGKSPEEIKDIINDGLKQAGFSDEEVAGVADTQVAAIVDATKQKVALQQEREKLIAKATELSLEAEKLQKLKEELEQKAQNQIAQQSQLNKKESELKEQALKLQAQEDVLDTATKELDKLKKELEQKAQNQAAQQSQLNKKESELKEQALKLQAQQNAVDAAAKELDKLKQELSQNNNGSQNDDTSDNGTGNNGDDQVGAEPGKNDDSSSWWKPSGGSDSVKGILGIAAGVGALGLIFGGIFSIFNFFNGAGDIQAKVRDVLAQIGIRF